MIKGCLAVILVLSLVASSWASLIIAKEYEPDNIVVNQPVEITVRVYNLGKSPIVSVYVDEPTADNKTAFNIISGSGTSKIDLIEPNTNATHSYTIVPRVAGDIVDKPAIVRFKEEGSTKIRVAQSSTRGRLNVLTEQEYEAKYAKHPKEWAIFALIAGLTIVLPYNMYQSSPAKKMDFKSKTQ